MGARLSVIAVLLGGLCLSAATSAAEPSLYHAVYRARSAGMSATAERELRQGNEQTLLLVNSLELKVAGMRLGRAEESSEFSWRDGVLTPLSYSYEQSGIRDQMESVMFDWQSGTALSREDDEEWILDVSPGVADKLSYQFLLGRQLLNNSAGELTFQVVDTDEIETHLYRVVGSEIIETGAGRLETLKVERVRAADSRRQTTYWLARDWEMLLVKLLQVSGSGSETELLLDHAEVNGQAVSGLP